MVPPLPSEWQKVVEGAKALGKVFEGLEGAVYQKTHQQIMELYPRMCEFIEWGKIKPGMPTRIDDYFGPASYFPMSRKTFNAWARICHPRNGKLRELADSGSLSFRVINEPQWSLLERAGELSLVG